MVRISQNFCLLPENRNLIFDEIKPIIEELRVKVACSTNPLIWELTDRSDIFSLRAESNGETLGEFSYEELNSECITTRLTARFLGSSDS